MSDCDLTDIPIPRTACEIVANVVPTGPLARFALELVMCPECGVHYAIAADLVAIRSEQQGEDADDDLALYCPNGHKWWWGQSFSALVEGQVSKASETLGEGSGASVKTAGVKKLQRELAQVRHDREQLEAQLSALKAGGKRRGSGKGGKREDPPA